jgi:hypothetical protein
MFVEQEATLFQICRREWPKLDLPIVDLSHVPQDCIAVHVADRAKGFAGARFDLSRDLMLRTELLRFGPAHHVLLRVVHHIAFDGWSSNIFWNELAALYNAFLQGDASPLAELPRS